MLASVFYITWARDTVGDSGWDPDSRELGKPALAACIKSEYFKNNQDHFEHPCPLTHPAQAGLLDVSLQEERWRRRPRHYLICILLL